MNDVLLYIGSAVLIVWGIAHIIPTKNVVNGFGQISEDNKRMITMEWVAEGLCMIFIGSLVLVITLAKGADDGAMIIVYRTSAIMLLIMAGVTLLVVLALLLPFLNMGKMVGQ